MSIFKPTNTPKQNPSTINLDKSLPTVYIYAQNTRCGENGWQSSVSGQVSGIYGGNWTTFSSECEALSKGVTICIYQSYESLSTDVKTKLTLAIPKLQSISGQVVSSPKPTTLDFQIVRCPKVYIPVCGSNGKTYGNSCEAKAAGVSYVEGACDPNRILFNPAKPTPLPPIPVDPSCDRAQCPPGTRKILPRSNATHFSGRPLSSSVPISDKRGRPLVVGDVVCPYECEFINSPVGGEQPPITSVCPEVYAPVCGTNGQTYRNECFAERSGFKIAYLGECLNPSQCTKLINPKNLTVSCDTCVSPIGNNRPRVTATLKWRIPAPSELGYIADHCTVSYEIQVLGNNTGLAEEYIQKIIVPFSSQYNPNQYRTTIDLPKIVGERGPVTFRIRSVATDRTVLGDATAGNWFNFSGSFSAEGCCPSLFPTNPEPTEEIDDSVIVPGARVLPARPPLTSVTIAPEEKECRLCDAPPGALCMIRKEPVCGTDGETYYHPRLAECAGVGIAYVGACQPSPPTPPGLPPPNRPSKPGEPGPTTLCPQVYKPVCGSNGQTYGNSCEAQRAGITSFTAGACPVVSPKPPAPPSKPPTQGPVITVPEGTRCMPSPDGTGTVGIPKRLILQPAPPVCGKVDDKWIAFESVCHAFSAGVTEYMEGPCPKEPPLKPGAPDTDPTCVQVFDPVCGSDGKTYSNYCYARAAGVTFTKGPCKGPVDPVPKKPDLPPPLPNPKPNPNDPPQKPGHPGPGGPNFGPGAPGGDGGFCGYGFL